MNLGLTTSFIVAGILLLSILSMNNNISQSSTELTMRQITQQRAGVIGEILQKDIPNIGYQQNSTVASPITDAREDLIEFSSDIDNDGTVETVTWSFTSTDVSTTPNPDDKVLTRTVSGDLTEFKNGVTNFDITYYDGNRNQINYNLISSLLGGGQSERDNIRYIEIRFTIESPEQVGGAGSSDPYYIETVWAKQFTPINLRL